MKIIMKKSAPGALDGGLRVVMFDKGKVYDTLTMEGVGEVFLKIGFAEPWEPPVQFQRRMVQAAPENKMEKPVPLKKGADFFSGMRAGQIRAWAAANGIDLTNVPGNTTAKRIVEIVLERQ